MHNIASGNMESQQSGISLDPTSKLNVTSVVQLPAKMPPPKAL